MVFMCYLIPLLLSKLKTLQETLLHYGYSHGYSIIYIKWILEYTWRFTTTSIVVFSGRGGCVNWSMDFLWNSISAHEITSFIIKAEEIRNLHFRYWDHIQNPLTRSMDTFPSFCSFLRCLGSTYYANLRNVPFSVVVIFPFLPSNHNPRFTQHLTLNRTVLDRSLEYISFIIYISVRLISLQRHTLHHEQHISTTWRGESARKRVEQDWRVHCQTQSTFTLRPRIHLVSCTISPYLCNLCHHCDAGCRNCGGVIICNDPQANHRRPLR